MPDSPNEDGAGVLSCEAKHLGDNRSLLFYFKVHGFTHRFRE